MENQNNTVSQSEKKHSHSSHHHHHHRHHHDKAKYVTGYSDYGSGKKRYHHYHSDSSSKRERKGINIEYKRIKKERIINMIKRSVFCAILLFFLGFVVYSIIDGGDFQPPNPDKTNETQSTEELEKKIEELEAEIYMLEQQIKEYENTNK